MTKFEKLRVSFRYWALGCAGLNPEYFKVVEALEYAGTLHTGTRKDKVTPEYQHQLEIAHYLRTLLPSISFPVPTLCAALLHDVAEDYDIGFEELERLFGVQTVQAVRRLSKKHRGVVVPTETYFTQIGQDPIASLVKGADRINNLQSMLGVFSLEKRKAYAQEARTLFIPMLKSARRQFPRQEHAYENIKHVMRSQLELLDAITD